MKYIARGEKWLAKDLTPLPENRVEHSKASISAMAEILKGGWAQVYSMTVRRTGIGAYTALNGNRRLQAIKTLPDAETYHVIADVVECTDAEAVELIYQLNSRDLEVSSPMPDRLLLTLPLCQRDVVDVLASDPSDVGQASYERRFATTTYTSRLVVNLAAVCSLTALDWCSEYRLYRDASVEDQKRGVGLRAPTWEADAVETGPDGKKRHRLIVFRDRAHATLKACGKGAFDSTQAALRHELRALIRSNFKPESDTATPATVKVPDRQKIEEAVKSELTGVAHSAALKGLLSGSLASPWTGDARLAMDAIATASADQLAYILAAARRCGAATTPPAMIDSAYEEAVKTDAARSSIKAVTKLKKK